MSEAEEKLVRIEWEPTDSFDFPLAAHMIVNFDASHFYIRFYHIAPPPSFGEPVPPDSVKARFITGVAIPAVQMRSVVEALRKNLEKFDTVQQGLIDELLDPDNEADHE